MVAKCQNTLGEPILCGKKIATNLHTSAKSKKILCPHCSASENAYDGYTSDMYTKGENMKTSLACLLHDFSPNRVFDEPIDACVGVDEL